MQWDPHQQTFRPFQAYYIIALRGSDPKTGEDVYQTRSRLFDDPRRAVHFKNKLNSELTDDERKHGFENIILRMEYSIPSAHNGH